MNAFTRSRFFLCLLSLAAFPSSDLSANDSKCDGCTSPSTTSGQLENSDRRSQDKIKNLTSTTASSPNSWGVRRQKGGMRRQSSKTSEASKELKTVQTESKATADHKTFSEDEEAAARYDNVPLDPRYPNYFRLPGTRTSCALAAMPRAISLSTLGPRETRNDLSGHHSHSRTSCQRKQPNHFRASQPYQR